MKAIIFLQHRFPRRKNIALHSVMMAGAGTLLMLLPAFSQADAANAFQVHGFLALAGFYSSDNNLHGESDDALSTDYNEAGINAAWSPANSLRLAGQLTTRNDGNSDNGEVRVDYLNADWQFLARDAWHVGARAGRVRNIYGFYNDTRDVAHTRPGITLPSVIYLDQVRDVFMSRDGYDLYGDFYTEFGAFSVDGGSGKLTVDDDIVSEALLTPIDGVDANGAHTDQFHIRWDSPSSEWRLAYSYMRFATDLEYFFVDGDFALTMNLVSMQYTAERWQFTSEYLRFTYDVNFGKIAQFPGEVVWAQYNYFLSQSWQVYARYESAVFDRDHRGGSSIQDDVGFPRHVGFRRDAGIGVRWDIDQHWMVAAEAHYLEGVLGISITDNNLQETTPYWTMAAFEVAFRF